MKHLRQYKIKEISHRDPSGWQPFLDARAVSEMHGADDKMNAEVHRVMIDSISNQKPDLVLGEKPDLLDIFRQRLVHKKTTKENILLEIIMPKQEFFFRVKRIKDLGADVKEVGRGQISWEMSVNNPNISTKSLYQLRYYPHIYIQPVEDLGPDGPNAYLYRWKIYGGRYDDYIPVEWLHNAELETSISPLEEAAVHRGYVDVTTGGGAKACYLYPITRVGTETYITDLAWKRGRHFMLDQQNCKKDYKWKKLLFSEVNMVFNMKSEVIFDRWLIGGRGPALSHNDTDTITGRLRSQVGPTWLDQLKGQGFRSYNHRRFNLKLLLENAKRKFVHSDYPNKESAVIDWYTGDGGWSLIQPELKRLDTGRGQNFNWEYIEMKDNRMKNGRKQLKINAKQYTGIFLDPYGSVDFHISKILNKGLLCGPREFNGYKYSSYWMILMAGKGLDGDSRKNSSTYIYTNDDLEQRTALVGSYTPNGPIGKGNNSRYPSAGDIGNKYKYINEQAKAVLVPNLEGISIWFPSFKESKRVYY